MRCKVCGCTEREPCCPACGWSDIEPNLCTVCEDAADALVEWALAARRTNMAGLMRVFNRRLGEQPMDFTLTEKGREALQ